MKKRQLVELEKINKLKLRLSTFPKPHDTINIRKFVICKLKHAEHFMEINCRELAIENMTDALFMLSYNEADRILNLMKCTISPRIYVLVYNQYTQLKHLSICNSCQQCYT